MSLSLRVCKVLAHAIYSIPLVSWPNSDRDILVSVLFFALRAVPSAKSLDTSERRHCIHSQGRTRGTPLDHSAGVPLLGELKRKGPLSTTYLTASHSCFYFPKDYETIFRSAKHIPIDFSLGLKDFGEHFTFQKKSVSGVSRFRQKIFGIRPHGPGVAIFVFAWALALSFTFKRIPPSRRRR